MAATFTPRLDILPPAQQRLWQELRETPKEFILYGGTAIALRLGHRPSVDFDFFGPEPFNPATLLAGISYLKGATVRQMAANTLTVTVDRGGPVQISYFGGLSLGQAAPAETVAGPELPVASLLDLAGTKVAVVTQRAEVKDYIDIHALLTTAHIPLPNMLAAAQVIYGQEFNPLVSLKAIAYHDDPALQDLSQAVRGALTSAVKKVDIHDLPRLTPFKIRGVRS